MNTSSGPADPVNVDTKDDPANLVNTSSGPADPVIVDIKSDPTNLVNTSSCLADPVNVDTKSDLANPVNTSNGLADPVNIDTKNDPVIPLNTSNGPADPVIVDIKSDPANLVNTSNSPADPVIEDIRSDPANPVNTSNAPADPVNVDTRSDTADPLNNISADCLDTRDGPAIHLDTNVIALAVNPEDTINISADPEEAASSSSNLSDTQNALGNTVSTGAISESLVDSKLTPRDAEHIDPTSSQTEKNNIDNSGAASDVQASLENSALMGDADCTVNIPADGLLQKSTPENTGNIDNAPAMPAYPNQHSETKTGTEFLNHSESSQPGTERQPSSLPGNGQGVTASLGPRLPKLTRGTLPNSDSVSCSRSVNHKSRCQLMAKRAETVYSQKLRRSSTRGKAAVVRQKENLAQNSAPSWARVRSAQPHVYRGVVRVASRMNQRRCKSVLDMASSKEAGSRCPSRGQTPGLHDAR